MVEPRRSISETELDILKVLWEHGPGTVREVNALLRRQGRRWAYTTVLTLLQRLEAKGVVTSDKSGVAHVFRPAVTRQKLLRQRLKDLANQLCEGTATPLVQALVEGQRFTADEISHFRQLLDDLESKKSKGPGEMRKSQDGPDA
jgi:BlaI family transcriptional regulator, penicillinase repressor